jgi:cobalt/nickel transport system permease protein
MIPALLAVHISDGVLLWPWLAGGFALAACLLAWSAYRVADAEIPYIGLLTAVFFVASQIHVRVGPTSVHLLLNGLVGIILGRRAVLAVTVGLLFQVLLFAHGGYSSLGINICVMSIPALLVRPMFSAMSRPPDYPSLRFRDCTLAVAYVLSPGLMLALVGAIIVSRLLKWRWDDWGFRAGFMAGMVSVLMTALLNAIVLVAGGAEDWRIVAWVVIAAHIPIAFIEGMIVGSTVSFLKRVKPQMLAPSL